MKSKYGNYSPNQIHKLKLSLQKSIFFLLIQVDKNTKDECSGINVDDSFRNLQLRLNGLNSILLEPVELINVMGMIESAFNELKSENFSYKRYRKLILDAGEEVMKIEEGGE